MYVLHYNYNLTEIGRCRRVMLGDIFDFVGSAMIESFEVDDNWDSSVRKLLFTNGQLYTVQYNDVDEEQLNENELMQISREKYEQKYHYCITLS